MAVWKRHRWHKQTAWSFQHIFLIPNLFKDYLNFLNQKKKKLKERHRQTMYWPRAYKRSSISNLFHAFSECDELHPCQGLGEHAHFRSFGMAFLTLFRIATGDNWNGIMKDTLREECDDKEDCLRNCCVSPYFAPLFFVVFVLMAQFVLVNVVVAVLMKHLEESHKQVW